MLSYLSRVGDYEMIDWVRIEERLPEISDYSVLIWFEDDYNAYEGEW